MISSKRYCSGCGAANPPEAASCFACGVSLKITAPLSHEGIGTYLLHQRYRILAHVGAGGFSTVYKAEDTLSGNRLVAIKAITLRELRPHEVIEATDAFNREMLVLSGLKHPNLPQIYDHFSDAECWYLAMDFIEGITLEKHLDNMQDRRLPVGEVLEIGILLCTVLEYLHTHQPPIIFRDLKPANIMLTPDRGIALIDFGIARHFKPGQAKDTIPFGSPGYAAPEQYGRAQTTPRADIYSLGVLLHQLLTGDDPSQTPFHFAPLQLQDQPALAELEPLIMRMVDMDAEKRPASISEIKQELQRIDKEWSTQYRQGLKQNGPYAHQPPTAFWQVFRPPDQDASTPVAVGAGGQMSLLQQLSSGTGSSSTTSANRSTPGAKFEILWRNPLAFASFILGLVGMFLPLLFFRFQSSLNFDMQTSRFTYFVLLLLLVGPSILAVIFGHMAKRRAEAIPALQRSKRIAMTGLIMGYTFGVIYSGFICLLLFLIVS